MDPVKDQDVIQKLQNLALQIRQDFDLLVTTLKKSEEAGTMTSASFSGFFSYLQAQFDSFSALSRQVENPESHPELLYIKEDVSKLFALFHRLRSRFTDHTESQDSPIVDDDLLDSLEVDDDCDDDNDSMEDENLLEDDLIEDAAENKRPGRKRSTVIHRPHISPSMPPPDIVQIRQENQLKSELLKEEEQRQEYVRRKEQEQMIAYRYRMEQSDHFEKPDFHHYDYHSLNRSSQNNSDKTGSSPASVSGYPFPFPSFAPVIPTTPPGCGHQFDKGYPKLRQFLMEQHQQELSHAVSQPAIHSNGLDSERNTTNVNRYRPVKASSSYQNMPPPSPVSTAAIRNPKELAYPSRQKKHSSGPLPSAPLKSQNYPSKVDNNIQKKHMYHLKGITTQLGYGIQATLQQELHHAANKADNDVIRAGMNTRYYVRTASAAAGIVSGLATSPITHLRTSAQRTLSSRQMAKFTSDTLRDHRELTRHISELSHQIKYASPPSQKQSLRKELSALNKKLPAMEKSVKICHRVQAFQHERTLDSKIIDAFTINHRVPRSAKSLQELGQNLIRSNTMGIAKQFGEDALCKAPAQLQREIQRTLKSSQAVKAQIKLLEHKGCLLSPEERRLLMQMKQHSKQLGLQVGQTMKLKASLEDLSYIQKQVDSVLQRAYRSRQNLMTVASFLRNSMLQPLYQPENNTEGLARGISFVSDPTVQRIASGAVRTMIHAPAKAFGSIAPEISNRLHIRQQLQKEKVKKLTRESVRKIRSQVVTAEQKIFSSAPAQVQSSVKAAASVQKAVGSKISKVNIGAHDKAVQFKNWLSNTKAVQMKRMATAKLEKVSEYCGKLAAVIRGFIMKFLCAILISILILSIIPGTISVITSLCSSVIMAPDTNEEGKIDLSPYTAILNSEFQRFNNLRREEQDAVIKEIDEIEADFNSRYNRPPKFRLIEPETYEDTYSEVKVNVDGPATNDRELIAMMAVRFEQDLENPKAKEYLRYMAQRCRVQEAVVDRSYTHSPGCVLIEEMIPPRVPPATGPTEPDPVRPPGGGSHVVPGIRSIVKPGGSGEPVPTDPPTPTEPPKPTFERRYVCPGHRELRIDVHVLTLDELYEADDFSGGLPDWEGWTEENRDWVQVMLDMDWAELYTGFRHGGMIPVTSEISPEEEKHIWDSLVRIIGGEYGAAGVMGNLFCESRLVSTNLEDQYETLLGYSNESYTAAVDSGAYTNFIDDAAGYGLAQWTYSTRKEGLLHAAQSQGKSIGDLDIQLHYLDHELQGYGMIGRLSTMGSVEEASDYILYNFERPENPDVLRDTRRGISNYFYNKYVLGTAAEGKLTQAQMDVIRVATNSDAYGIAARGGYCQAWAANVYGVAGFPIDGSSCARQSGERYGVSSDFTTVPPGAAVYGYSGSKYGHVGIYVGGGLVYHNIGGVAVDRLENWVSAYGGFAWGWQAGTDLTALP